MRAVRAELRAAAARQQREPAADRPREPLFSRLPAAVFPDQIPARKRQRVEVVDLLADHPAAGRRVVGEANDRRFGLALEHEIAVVGEELRHLRRRDADEADLHAARAHAVGPRRLVLVIDQRREHERDIGVGLGATGESHFMAAARENRGGVSQVDARHVVELFLEIRHHGRHARKRIEPRSVTADDRVLADEPACGRQICEKHSHQSPRIGKP